MKEIRNDMTLEEYFKEFEEVEKIIEMHQDKEGHFYIKTEHPILPTAQVNNILKMMHKVYKDQSFNKAMETIPEAHKDYTASLEFKLRVYKFFNYVLFVLAVLFMLLHFEVFR